MEEEKIILSPAQMTSIFWVSRIKQKVKEIASYKPRNKTEEIFFKAFCNYSDIEWRQLYLKLTLYVDRDMKENIHTSDEFIEQDTDRGCHHKLDKAISDIVGVDIWNVRLASSDTKDGVIYTYQDKVKYWYKSCGISQLDNEYNSHYILNGNIDELNLRLLLLATIYKIYSIDKSFDSVRRLRQLFCMEYQKLNQVEDINELGKKFNKAFHELFLEGIITGDFWKPMYFPHFRPTDLNGTTPFMELADYYANTILETIIEEGPKEPTSGKH